MAIRKRSRAADVAAETADGYRRHRTGRNAALVAHYGFLSIFPLLLAATTVLGLVLRNRPKLQADIVDSALAQLPIVGQQIADDPSKLSGNVMVLIIGLLLALWAAMKAFTMLQTALDDVAEVPLGDRPNLARSRLHALTGIAIVGTAQVGVAIISSFVGVTGIPGISKVLLVVATVAVDTVVLTASYRWLTSTSPPWRILWPGGLVGGVAFAGLQLVGTAVVGRAIARASPVYGTFASVIGLFTWLGLHATVALAGAELNRALVTTRR
jgi:uncharacterized BrkB/YihY/UPF0761 family membrane protein